MELFDTHCHLDVEAFDPDRATVLAAARDASVGQLLIPAIERRGWEELWGLCRTHDGLY
ncbi:MAG: TatD family deoxyribonuclease, partial [Gammaproteobacteria bacterium]